MCINYRYVYKDCYGHDKSNIRNGHSINYEITNCLQHHLEFNCKSELVTNVALSDKSINFLIVSINFDLFR